MSLLRLSLVTQTLMNLISASVTASPEWTPGPPLAVLPDPPDKLSGTRVVGLHLYSVREDPSSRNDVEYRDPSAPARFSPMGLILAYQLTAQVTGAVVPGAGTLEEQFLMGLSMLALRNHAIVDDSTVVGGKAVLVPALRGRGNVLRISQEPVKAPDAVDYWTAGKDPLRLAAYYEVTAVQLEPDPIERGGGRILMVGVQSFVSGVPRIDSTSNLTSFTVPGESVPRTVAVSPAEVGVGEAFTIAGADLTGDTVDLRVRQADWPDSETVDPTLWSVASAPGGLAAAVASTAGARAVLPGLYSVTVVVGRTRTMPDGSNRRFGSESNTVPFVVVPRIDATTVGLAGAFTLTGGRFSPVDLPGDLVRVVLGSDPLARVAGAPGPGQFQVVDDATISAVAPASTQPGVPLPVRLLVRGAESAPRWLVFP